MLSLCKCRTRSGIPKAPSAPAPAGLPSSGGYEEAGGGGGALPSALCGLPAPRRSALRPGPRRSGPPGRCAPHFPGCGDRGGCLRTALAQELPGEVTRPRCSPAALARRQEGPRRRRSADRASFHTAGRTRALSGCQWQGFVTSGARGPRPGPHSPSAGSSPPWEAEAVWEKAIVSTPWVLQVETPWAAQVAVPVPSSLVSSDAGQGAGQGQAGSCWWDADGHLEGQRPRAGLPGTRLSTNAHANGRKDQPVPGGPMAAGRLSAPSPV